LAEAQRKGHKIGFDVLYCAKSRNHTKCLNEIGEKEGEYIRKIKPALNTQIPKEENWQHFDVQKINVKDILNSL